MLQADMLILSAARLYKCDCWLVRATVGRISTKAVVPCQNKFILKNFSVLF